MLIFIFSILNVVLGVKHSIELLVYYSFHLQNISANATKATALQLKDQPEHC